MTFYKFDVSLSWNKVNNTPGNRIILLIFFIWHILNLLLFPKQCRKVAKLVLWLNLFKQEKHFFIDNLDSIATTSHFLKHLRICSVWRVHQGSLPSRINNRVQTFYSWLLLAVLLPALNLNKSFNLCSWKIYLSSLKDAPCTCIILLFLFGAHLKPESDFICSFAGLQWQIYSWGSWRKLHKKKKTPKKSIDYYIVKVALTLHTTAAVCWMILQVFYSSCNSMLKDLMEKLFPLDLN